VALVDIVAHTHKWLYTHIVAHTLTHTHKWLVTDHPANEGATSQGVSSEGVRLTTVCPVLRVHKAGVMAGRQKRSRSHGRSTSDGR